MPSIDEASAAVVASTDDAEHRRGRGRVHRDGGGLHGRPADAGRRGAASVAFRFVVVVYTGDECCVLWMLLSLLDVC